MTSHYWHVVNVKIPDRFTDENAAHTSHRFQLLKIHSGVFFLHKMLATGSYPSVSVQRNLGTN